MEPAAPAPRLERKEILTKPELVQFGDLTEAHFQRHPVWIQCHTADYDAPWYDETDEETFRPCEEPSPGPEMGMLLVRARATLADGTVLPAFLTPIFEEGHPGVSHPLGGMQPQLFLPSGKRQPFWCGIMEPTSEERRTFYREIGRTPEQVFPIRFAVEPGLATGGLSGVVEGFYVLRNFSDPPGTVR